MKPTITCKICSGTGKVHLPPEYQATLDAYGKRKLASCADLRATLIKRGKLSASKHLSQETLIHKRVKKLVSWGVLRKVERRKPETGDNGLRLHRAWVYERV